MSSEATTKDAEKMVLTMAKAMAMADVGAGTDRVVLLYVDDARKVLIETLKAAKRHQWELAELLSALDPPKPKVKHWGQQQDPQAARRES